MNNKDWYKDKYAEVTNAMLIDDEHAQDDGEQNNMIKKLKIFID